MEGLYTIDELTKNIINEYKLKNPEKCYMTYYQRIRRALIKSGLLEQGVEIFNPETKRKKTYYNENHKQIILSEKNLYNYVRKKSTLELYRKSPRYNEVQQQIDSTRQKYLDHLSLQMTSSEAMNYSTITEKELKEKKYHIMLEALFNIYYTEFDDKLFYNDLKLIENATDEHIDPLQAEAQDRLNNPEGNYYNRRNTRKSQR